MQSYKLIVAYDGTDYHGWQKQLKQVTVAEMLEHKFSKVFGQSIELSAASRTDAGVHALGQVATFYTSLNIDPDRMRSAWNGKLPADIVIQSIEQLHEPFHVQHMVVQKTYWYHVCLKRPLPFVARYGYWHRFPFTVEKLQEGLNCFVGTHDFRSFCTGDEHTSTIRTVDAITIEQISQFDALRIVIKGPGFLRYMIRRMVGAALTVASQPSLSVEDILRILHEKNPEHKLPTAPARGLVLKKITY